MKNDYDVIIVGGGLAGLTGAAYLSKYGLRTLLCEKSEHTGGLVKTFWHGDFAFDAGIRAFENSGILLPMLKSLGIEIEFVNNPVSIGIKNQWVKLNSKNSLQDYSSMLTSLFPNNKADIENIIKEIQKVMGYMDVIYGIDNPLFLENMKDKDYLLKTLLPWLLKYQINISRANRLNMPVKTYLQKFTSNTSLIDMIIQHFFKNTPTSFALSYFALYLDYGYPKGGTGVLAKKVTEYILSRGGEVSLKTTANRIDTSKNELYTDDGRVLSYKKLVWAANQKTLYSALSGTQNSKVETQSKLVSKCEGGDSILTLFMGVSQETGFFENICGSHAFYTPSTDGLSCLTTWEAAAVRGYDELLLWVQSYLESTTYEISCPALRDSSLAPQGSTGVIVSTLLDYKLVRYVSNNGSYDSFKQFCTEKITQTLENSLFPDIRKNMLFALCSTPLTIERETGNSDGAITGWAFKGDAMPAERRFKKIAESVLTPIKDIYQCGQWTFSPSGLPVSILTGKLATDSVKKSLKGITP